MFDRFRLNRPFRYSRWDGTQRLDDLEAEDILDALSDDYLKHGDLRRALERMMREGFTSRNGMRQMGMQDLLERLRERRQQRMERYNLSGVMDDIKQRLERIKQMERDGIQRRLDEQPGQQGQSQPGQQEEASAEAGQSQEGQPGGQAGEQPGDQPGQQAAQSGQQGQRGQQGGPPQGAPDGLGPDALRKMLENIANKKLQYLEQLPQDPAGQIQQLSQYDFMDEQAREEFQQLLQMLQQQVMQQYFQGMTQAIQSMTPEDLARMREMVRELNQMLRQRAQGEEPDFDSFMQKYGDFFGPGINTLDDLIEQMAQRQAQMQALMDSMSAEQREQLRDMIDQLIGDDRLRVDLAELAMNLEAMSPSSRRTRFNLSGDEPLSMTEAMALMGTLQEMDELEQRMREARRSGELGDLNPDQLRDLVGDEEAQSLEQLQALLKQLEDDGMVRRSGDRLELTARGIRRIGQKALQDVFSQLKRDAFGRHRLPERGYGGERDEATKPYVFGEPFELNLERTIMNAINREGAGAPVSLAKDDFEVYHTEHMTRSSTVLMLDMSWSMLQNDLWAPAKKVAIALESLIRSQFPRDSLYVVGFSSFAREYKAEELIELGEWDNVQGTNMMHGLMVARRLLARSRGANKQIIMITDGGPTVYQRNGSWTFDWPPPPEALMQTLREVRRCARENITINVFMLWDDPYLKHFVNQMATVNRGRAFYTDPDDLAEYVMIDYLSNKQKRVR
ncbi:MAG TPA: VWA domain-containing protein [Ktedonobacterales bacterium]|nr:VWA domain-containing protein [Ktedonobacterales bacterium]